MLPFKLVIPDERAMYWVKGVEAITFTKGESASSSLEIKNIHIIENLSLNKKDIKLEDTNVSAYPLNQLLDKIKTETSQDNISTISIKASDKLEKEVSIDVFKKAYLTTDEKNFTSEDMKKGMTIKEVASINIGEDVFVSLDSLSSMIGKDLSKDSYTLDELLKELNISSAINIGDSSIAIENLNNFNVVKEDDNYKLLNTKDNKRLDIVNITIDNN